MELNKFVSTVLTQIAEGVDNAKPELEKRGVQLNPQIDTSNADIRVFRDSNKKGNYLTVVEFNVSLCVDTTDSNSTGFGVFFGSIGIGNKQSDNQRNSEVTSLKFDIPIVLPR